MPYILDNIELHLRPAWRGTLGLAHCADFCVGYVHLRGCNSVSDIVASWQGG